MTLPSLRGAAVLAAAALAFPLSLVEATSVARVEVHRFAETDRVRPAEAVGGARTPGAVTEVLSDPAVAAGLYFLVTLDASARGLPAGARAEVSTLGPDELTPRVVVLALPDTRVWTPDLTLALTGASDPGYSPVAWRVRILDASGAVVTERASTLW